MKLRARGPPRRVNGDADEDMEVLEAPSSRRRPARESMAPRAAAPTPARPRPRTTPRPRGGVQKRQSVRPTAAARPRAAAPTPSRSSRRTARPPPESQPPLAAAKGIEDEADGLEEPDAKAAKFQDDVQQEKRVVKAATTIDDLPEEVMLGIFSYFRPPQLCWKIGRVCRRWASWSVAPFLWRGRQYTLSPDPSLGSKGKA